MRLQSTMTELDLLGDSKLIPKTLVLIYVNPSADLKPINTRKWIESRKGVHRHVQVILLKVQCELCNVSAGSLAHKQSTL